MSWQCWECAILTGALNLAVVLLGAPLIMGIVGKVKARLSGRPGPALLQPWRDLLKLFGKEEIFTYGDLVGRWAPASGFASLMAATLLMPMGTVRAPASFTGDGMALIGLVILIGASAAVAASTGRTRPVQTSFNLCTVAVEPALSLCLIASMMRGECLSMEVIIKGHASGPLTGATALGIASILIALAVSAARGTPRLPAVNWEAGSDFPGLSGPKLALAWWSAHARLILYAAIFVELYLPWPGIPRGGYGFAACLAKTLAVAVLVHFVAVPRAKLLRSEIWLGVSWILALGAVVATLFGL